MKYWTCSRSMSAGACGDFIECVQLGDSQYAIIVGDVAGHGGLAGETATALSAYTRRIVADGLPLTNMFHLASQYFIRTILTDLLPFASLFVAIADLRFGTVRYVSAGHEPAVLFSLDGTHEHLCPTGPLLGIAKDAIFGERRLQIRDESLFVVVTDGITDARHDKDEGLVFFGTRGVVKAVRDATRDGRDPVETICASALEHAGGMLADDASVFVSSLSPVARPFAVSGARDR